MIRKLAAAFLFAVFASSNAYADSAASIPYGTTGHKLCRVDQNCVFSGNVTFTGAQGPAVGNTNYTILSTDKVVYTSATLTAPRTWTLPAANSVAAGYRLIVVDLFGGVSSSNFLTVTTPFGSFDTLLGNGNSGSATIKEANGEVQFISDGTSAWVYSMIQTGGGALAVTPVSHNFLTGLSPTNNTFSKAQPAFTDISGSATTAQLPGSGVTTVNGVSCTIGSTCTSGNYVVCSSGASVAAGADTTEDILATCIVPAAALTANGCMTVSGILDYTNSVNNKTLKVRVNTNGTATGTVYINTIIAASTSNFPFQTKICGANSTSAQIGGPSSGIASSNAGALITSALNTANAWDIVITGQKATSGEVLTLDQYQVVNTPF